MALSNDDILNAISDNNFLIFFVLINKIPFLNFLNFFSDTIILEPFFIASEINLFPSVLLPLIAKKILFFSTLSLSKEMPEKKNLWNFLSIFGI